MTEDEVERALLALDGEEHRATPYIKDFKECRERFAHHEKAVRRCYISSLIELLTHEYEELTIIDRNRYQSNDDFRHLLKLEHKLGRRNARENMEYFCDALPTRVRELKAELEGLR